MNPMSAPTANVTQQLSGHISAQVLNSSGEVVREVPEFRNLICNGGLDYLMSNIGSSLTTMAQYCKVGTGAGVPAAGDTALPGYLASAAMTASAGAFQVTTAPYYYEATYTYLYALGAVVGTLTCIGAYSASATSAIFAWSQIKDSGNNPTTLTVLAGEQLSVTYKFRLYAPTFSSSGSIAITGDASHPFTMWSCGFSTGNFGNAGGSAVPTPTLIQAMSWSSITPPADIKQYPALTSDFRSSMTVTNGAYTPGSFTRTITGFMGTTTNVTGNVIWGFQIYTNTTGPSYIMALTTSIPKDSTKTLTVTFSYTIARYP